ncbi:MAG TPA: hypothetical protein VMV49_18260 [Candidatus Deferrimicrobium sp.]|nr:hypothetical protein [Candidatus Deferrimicrobium sp.]
MKLQTNGVNPDYLPIINDGIQSLHVHFNILGVLLFGSLAKGKEKSFEDAISDVDLIILAENLPSVKERLLFLRTLQTDPRLRFFLLTPEEIKPMMTSTGWILDAFSYGKILYDPQDILQSLLALFHKKLREKQISETPHYWDRPAPFGDEIEL